jgi:hypothetical protein
MVKIGVSLEEDILDSVEERWEMSDCEGRSNVEALEFEIGVKGQLRMHSA